MRRIVLAVALASACWAQSPTQPYRDAHKVWREADPTLEKTAAEAGQLDARARVASEASAKYQAARGAYLRDLVEERSELLTWLQDSASVVELDMAPAADMQAMVTIATASVTNDIKTYSTDSDRLIQQLRQALEREKSSLETLAVAITERQKALDKATQALPGTEVARANALSEYQKLSHGSGDAVTQNDREQAAWAVYYESLAGAAKAMESGGPVLIPRARDARPSSSTPPAEAPTGVVVNGVRIMNPVKPAAPATVNPAPPETTTQVPLQTSTSTSTTAPPVLRSRYVGAWSFQPDGLFHGAQPDTADLLVNEEGGRLSGTLSIRFKLPPGAPEDPALSLMLSGELKPGRVQSLAVESADGRKGTLDLIPGPAFNLLEVNFQTDPQPRKIVSGNFLLVKK